VCRGSSLWFSSFGLVVFCSLLELGFCLSWVKLFPLPKGIETCLLQVISLFALCLAFDRLLKFICSFLFFAFSLWLSNMCVVNALIKG
jgi:hypothetical protein